MKPIVGIILGSGLNKFAQEISNPNIIREDKNSFHNLKIHSGKINGDEVILFSGRRHFYEGFGKEEVLENVELAKELGLKLLVVTNAAGGINKNFRVSDLMLITSHFNFINKSFPAKNITVCYETRLLNKVKSLAMEEKINLRSGSYCCSTGPMYETKSEIRFLSKLRADAVGMSTVPEILFANHNGIKTVGISCITNLLSENSRSITNHEEVLEAGKNSYANFSKLLKKIIGKSSEFL